MSRPNAIAHASSPAALRWGRRGRAAAGVAVTVLVLAGCAGGDADPDPEAPQVGDRIEGEDGTADPPTEPEPEPDDPADDGTDAGDDPADDPADGDGADDGADPEGDAVERLPGDASSHDVFVEQEGTARLAVVDVRVAGHDGFDRVVFELDGEGEAGWSLAYAADGIATSQGSGEPIEVAGDAALTVALQGTLYPGDLPDGIELRDPDTVAGPAGGVVTEVVSDTLFEGIHTFVIGTDGERPFLVERFDDPQRIVVDILHEG